MTEYLSLMPTPLNASRIMHIRSDAHTGWYIHHRGGCLVSVSALYATREEAEAALAKGHWDTRPWPTRSHL